MPCTYEYEAAAMQQLHAWELQGQARLHGNGEGCMRGCTPVPPGTGEAAWARRRLQVRLHPCDWTYL